MPIALLSFPYLVYDKILKKLSLKERFALATISKRARWIVKRSFGKHKFELDIRDIRLYFITRDDRKHISFSLDGSYSWFEEFNILKRVLTPLKDLGMDSEKALEKHYDLDGFATKVTQFLIDTFPNLTILMNFEDCKGSARSVTGVIKKSNLQIDRLSATCGNRKKLYDVLSNCDQVKTLHIYGHLHNRLAIPASLQCDEVKFDGSVCIAEQIVKLFMNCKRFSCSLRIQRFNAAGLLLILEAWKKSSRLEYLELNCYSGTYQNVMEKLKGEPKEFKLEDRSHDCHLIRQLNGKEAVIYTPASEDTEVIILLTDFELVVAP